MSPRTPTSGVTSRTGPKAKNRFISGLFHSGTGEVHFAEIDNVKEPVADEYGNLMAITPPKKEIVGVPDYYKDSLYSRGWLRIISISTTPQKFFSNYSFSDAPEISAYQSYQLQRFKDKKILDADELRAMDTTIWSVRETSTGRSNRALDHTGNKA